MDKKKTIDVLKIIIEDQENDALTFEGKPFNGRTVAEYFGNQGAAIAALANIVKKLIEDDSGISKLQNDVSCMLNGIIPD